LRLTRHRPDGDIEEQLGMNRIITGLSVSGPQFGVRRKVGKAAGFIGAALLCLATVAAPNVAEAAHGGGGGGGGGFHGGGFGGFHGGGFGGLHAGGFGGFRAGGFSGGGFHAQAPIGAGMDGAHAGEFHGGSGGGTVVLRGSERGGQWHQGWRDGRYGAWWGYDPYLWSDDGLYDDDYGAQQPQVSQYWYYCSNPAGYYPYVSQCSLPWQTVPAG
jgi:hypothetical protein